MKEPIIILPLSQYEEWKKKVDAANSTANNIIGAVMSAVIPKLLKAREEVMPYNKERLKKESAEVADEVLKRLGLD